MNQGRLIAVVGPSGVGKDSVMAGIVAADPSFRLVRRVITRAPEKGGEDYEPCTVEEFETAASKGAFCVHWGAHGLRYGIPISVLEDVANGANLIANFSRKALTEANALFSDLIVLNVTAKPETLAKRLAERGRETEDDIAKRLARAGQTLPEGLNVVEISNDGALEDAIAQALAALQPVRA